jgi:hypothetical protein
VRAYTKIGLAAVAVVAAVVGAGTIPPLAAQLSPEDSAPVAVDPSVNNGGYPITIVGDRQVPAYSFAELHVDVSQAVIWTVSPRPVRRRARGGYLYLAGVPGRQYTVTAVVNDQTKGVSQPAGITVAFALPDVPPGPNPPPVPPPPGPPDPPAPVVDVDADVQATLPKAPTAAERDLARVLAGLFAQVAVEVKKGSYATVGDFLAAYRDVRGNMVQSDLLMPARDKAAAKVYAVFPHEADTPLTNDAREAAAKLFARLANTFKGIL